MITWKQIKTLITPYCYINYYYISIDFKVFYIILDILKNFKKTLFVKLGCQTKNGMLVSRKFT